MASLLLVSVPDNQPFMEAGLDSLGGVDLRNALEARFSIGLPATAIIDYPSTAALAAYIVSQLAPHKVWLLCGILQDAALLAILIMDTVSTRHVRACTLKGLGIAGAAWRSSSSNCSHA